MTDPREPRTDLRALAVEYLKPYGLHASRDVKIDRLVKLLARVEYEAKLDALCLAAQEADEATMGHEGIAMNEYQAFCRGAARAATRIRQIKPEPLKRGGST